MSLPASVVRLLKAAILICAGISLAACTTAGRRFDQGGLDHLRPGETTYAQTLELMGGLPAATYPQSDGTVLAHWYHRVSVVTDGLYHSKEAMLQFSADGRFLRLVDSGNIVLDSWQRAYLLGAGSGGEQ